MAIPQEGFAASVFQQPNIVGQMFEMEQQYAAANQKAQPKPTLIDPEIFETSTGVGNEAVFDRVAELSTDFLTPEQKRLYAVGTTYGVADPEQLMQVRQIKNQIAQRNVKLNTFAKAFENTSNSLPEMAATVQTPTGEYASPMNDLVLKRGTLGQMFARAGRIDENERGELVANITEDELVNIVGADPKTFNYEAYEKAGKDERLNMLAMYFGNGTTILEDGSIEIPYSSEALLPTKESLVKNVDWRKDAQTRATKIKRNELNPSIVKTGAGDMVKQGSVFDPNATRREAMSMVFKNYLKPEEGVSLLGQQIMMDLNVSNPNQAVNEIFNVMQSVQSPALSFSRVPDDNTSAGERNKAIEGTSAYEFKRVPSPRTNGSTFISKIEGASPNVVAINIPSTTASKIKTLSGDKNDGNALFISALAYDPDNGVFYKRGVTESTLFTSMEGGASSLFVDKQQTDWQRATNDDIEKAKTAYGFQTQKQLKDFIREQNATEDDIFAPDPKDSGEKKTK